MVRYTTGQAAVTQGSLVVEYQTIISMAQGFPPKTSNIAVQTPMFLFLHQIRESNLVKRLSTHSLIHTRESNAQPRDIFHSTCQGPPRYTGSCRT